MKTFLVLVLLAGVACAEDDPLPAGAVARLGSSRLRHQDEVVSLAFSPDSRALASVGHDGAIRIWEVPSGKALLRFATHGDETVSWVGSRLGLVSERAVRFLELDGKETPGWHAQDERTCAVALSASGTAVGWGTKSGELHVCDAVTSAERWWIHAHDDHVLSIAFSPDEKLVATTSRDGKLRVFRGKETVASREVGLATWVGFSPDGNLVAVAADRLLLVRAEDGSVEYEAESERLHACAFAPGSGVLALLAHDRRVVVLDLEQRTRRSLEGRREAMTAVAFSPDGKTIATGDRSGTIVLWSAAECRPFELPRHASQVHGVAVSPDGKTIVTLARDGALHVWRDGGHREVFIDRGANAMSFESSRSLVVACGGSVRVLDLDAVVPPHTIDMASGTPDVVAVAASGTLFAAGSRSGVLTIRDGAVSHVHSLGAAVTCVAFAGSRVVVATADRLVRVMTSTDEVGRGRMPPGSFRVVSTLSASEDGTLLAVRWADGALRAFTLPGFDEKRRFDGLAHAAVSFAPSGHRLAIGMSDGSVKVVNCDTGAEERDLRGHSAGVACLAWSPDGARLISGSRDGTALVWKVD